MLISGKKTGLLIFALINLFLSFCLGLDWREKQLSYQMPSQDEQSFQKFHSESKFIRNKRRKASIRSELFALNQQNQTEQAEQFCQKVSFFIFGSKNSLS